MKRALALALLLAGCGAPAVQPPPALGVAPPCNANTPPAGYTGPISPHGVSCAPVLVPAPQPAGTFDYSQGMPPRAVRGQ